MDGDEVAACIALDSSKNYTTRALAARHGAPSPFGGKRKTLLDRAVTKLFTRTTAGALWSALAGTRLEVIHSYDITLAWQQGCWGRSDDAAAKQYPTFVNEAHYLHDLAKALCCPDHPWLR